MHTDLKLAAVELMRGRTQALPRARGRLVLCLSGTLWLTQEGDPRDVVLEAGDEARIDRHGLTLLHALRDVRYLLSDDNSAAAAH